MRIFGACLNVVAGMGLCYGTLVKDVPVLLGVMTAACLLTGFMLAIKEDV